MNEQEVIEQTDGINMSEELTESAAPQAGGESSDAGEAPDSMHPKYLYVKAKYIVSEFEGICGLIFLCLDKDGHGFSFIRTIAERNVEWINSINMSGSPETFYRIFNEQAKNPKQGSTLYEAKKITEGLTSQLKPSLFQEFFKIWQAFGSESAGTIPQNSSYSGTPEAGVDNIASALEETVRLSLEEVLLKRLEYFEADYNFLTSVHHDLMMTNLGLSTSEQADGSGKTGQVIEDTFKLYLKGNFLIDPAFGARVQDLEEGDFVYCEILDRSEVALSAARMIGAYKRGLWLPVRGRILEIEEKEDERCRFRLQLAKGVYLDTLSYINLRIRTEDYKSAAKRQLPEPETAAPTNSLALLVGVVLVAMLVMAFILMR